jgi:predicted porin
MFSKKTAVAAAVLLAAFAAQAQVNVYGNIDLSVGSYDEPGQGKSLTKVNSGDMRASFLGFKGQEDLGGGLKAFFKLETGLSADTGSIAAPGAAATEGSPAVASTFWNRASLIGLQSDFGTLTLGNTRSLLSLTTETYNPFADSSLFSASQNLFGYNNSSASNQRSNWVNSITFASANYSGFTGAVQLGLSEVSGIDASVGLQLNYTAGPLGLGFAYETQDLSANATQKAWQLGASYDFGVAKAFAQYGQVKETGFNSYKFFQIGAGVPVSANGSVLVSFGQGKQNDFKAREFSLAYDHALSKRTSAYVGLNNSRNSEAAPKSGTSVAAGIRHAF